MPNLPRGGLAFAGHLARGPHCAGVKISCLMPTYGRPTLVQNAIACFQAQDYPADRRRLLILDDAGQIASQHGEGWSVWSTSARMETLAAKYVELDLLDAGWADAFVIWDDDDIYLPWHLAAYAAALQNSRWAHPAKVWDLYTGRLELGPAKGRFWASAAVRTDFLRSLGGFTESARGDFDQINLRAWRNHGGEAGRPHPPSYVYGWGRSNHCSGLMFGHDAANWYSRHGMLETRNIQQIIPRMDPQTEAVYATLTASAKRNERSVVDCSNHCGADNLTRRAFAGEEFADSYDVLRALLASYEGGRENVTPDGARRTVFRCYEAQRPELLANLADEAEYHGVAPLLEPSISALAREIPEAIPDDVRLAFVALASRHRRATVLREKCIDQLLAAFATAGIPVILLKGAALAHLIYPAPERRPTVDIDILIDSVDEERAVLTGSGLGYAFAPRHGSRFAGRMHHLPAATMTKSGFRISLEIHLDAMSPDAPESLTFATLSAKPRPFQRGSGPQGLALDHTDMLRHLVRHAFEPSRRVRLKHLYDLRCY